MQTRRAVFLDRDGVLNKAIVCNGKAYSPRSKEEFIIVDDAADAVADLRDAGFKVFVVTNQPDIARGFLSQADLKWMTEKILSETYVDEVLVCPHDDHHKCACRKPAPGMLIECYQKWGIDLLDSYMVGDGWKDMEAGKNAGCKCILIDAEYNKGVPADWCANSLVEAVKIILGR
ncbi:MAG TPA: HAD-IIIA family hydrolase [Spirochaetota bacterium]|nr:HAD-IIIA family hydrolase [Spirochaetota bacterium]